jgi:hypothetical protein
MSFSLSAFPYGQVFTLAGEPATACIRASPAI